MKRRDFVERISMLSSMIAIPRLFGGTEPLAAAAGDGWPSESGLPAAADARGAAAAMSTVGVQLYTVRTEMKKSVEHTLSHVAEIGYKEVEFAGYFDKSPKEIRALLDTNHLKSPSTHVGLDTMRTGWAKALDDAATIGHEYIVVAWLPPEERKSLDNYKKIAGEFNQAGEAAKAHGLRFAYHNHDFEFEHVDGKLPYDTLLAETTPSVVAFEMDLFWITKGGQDPLAYFARSPGRFQMVHVKDMTKDGKMVAVGEGAIDFPKIFAKASQAGIKHYFVEHDEPKDPFSSIATSYAYLKGLKV